MPGMRNQQGRHLEQRLKRRGCDDKRSDSALLLGVAKVDQRGDHDVKLNTPKETSVGLVRIGLAWAVVTEASIDEAARGETMAVQDWRCLGEVELVLYRAYRSAAAVLSASCWRLAAAAGRIVELPPQRLRPIMTGGCASPGLSHR